MLKIKTNPLVLAAALGLLGPAALADDEEDTRISGVWSRTSVDVQPMPARLGEQLQVLPVDDAFVIEDGSHAPVGAWNIENGITQVVSFDEQTVRREFSTQGDDLYVHTVVTLNGLELAYDDVYTRVG